MNELYLAWKEKRGKKNRKYPANILNYLKSVIAYVIQLVMSYN